MKNKFKHESGYFGSSWLLADDSSIKLPSNFYAIDLSTGKEVIIISIKSTERDHGASSEVLRAKCYNKETLQPINFWLGDSDWGYGQPSRWFIEK